MTKQDTNFYGWFCTLQAELAKKGVRFEDMASVKQNYEDFENLYDIADAIWYEHQEGILRLKAVK